MSRNKFPKQIGESPCDSFPIYPRVSKAIMIAHTILVAVPKTHTYGDTHPTPVSFMPLTAELERMNRQESEHWSWFFQRRLGYTYKYEMNLQWGKISSNEWKECSSKYLTKWQRRAQSPTSLINVVISSQMGPHSSPLSPGPSSCHREQGSP